MDAAALNGFRDITLPKAGGLPGRRATPTRERPALKGAGHMDLRNSLNGEGAADETGSSAAISYAAWLVDASMAS